MNRCSWSWCECNVTPPAHTVNALASLTSRRYFTRASSIVFVGWSCFPYSMPNIRRASLLIALRDPLHTLAGLGGSSTEPNLIPAVIIPLWTIRVNWISTIVLRNKFKGCIKAEKTITDQSPRNMQTGWEPIRFGIKLSIVTLK